MPYKNPELKRTFDSWRCMMNRCTYPRDVKYHLYGGRGIVVCERWQKWKNFLADMGIRPAGTGKDKWTLDRIDSNGNYEPANCRWVQWDVQNRDARGQRVGFRHSEASKLKMRAVLIGNKRRVGSKLTEEHKAKISAASRGQKWSLGYKHTEEAKAKMSAQRKGRKFSPEFCAKRSAIMKAQWQDPEFRKRRLEAQRASQEASLA